MTPQDSLYRTYLAILNEELIPAMGCTEPIAIAYAAASARELLGCLPEKVEVGVSQSIFKNARSVIVPNTRRMKGVASAAAAGIVAGEASKKLEVISSVTDDQVTSIRSFCETVPVTVSLLETPYLFDIVICLEAGPQSAKTRITGHHTNLVYKESNGEVLLDLLEKDTAPSEELKANEAGSSAQPDTGCAEMADRTALPAADRSLLNIASIFEFAETVCLDDVRDLLDRQIAYNMAIAEEGLSHPHGANVGSTLMKFGGDSLTNQAKAMAAAGSDARMDGLEMPVIINSGSGNQGITVSVPVIVYARHHGVSDEKLYRSLVLSNLISVHIKDPIGTLSAYCGAVSAGAAAGAGIAYLETGDYKTITHTVVNALAVVSGIICDGAKSSCAAKIAAAVEAGIFGYHMYLNGQQFYGGDGILRKGIEQTLENIGELGRVGMEGTNDEIVRLMLEDTRPC